MKRWRLEEAERLGIKPVGVAMRIARKKYPDLKVWRVNSRVVLVSISES